MSTRKGDWIQTATGCQFWPVDPLPEDVCIEDIAHALAHQCRYSGHCRTFYSVAQHCCLVSDNCPRFPLYGLLHDAAEAYLIDLPRPVKKSFRAAGVTAYDDAEDAVMRAVWTRFGLPEPSADIVAEVEAADVLLLATEARDLMAPLHPDWHHRPENGYQCLMEPISPWTPGRSILEFSRRFQRLMGYPIR